MTDQELLAAQFEEHRDRLHRLAYRLLGSGAEADDAVQETWLRLARTGDDEIDNLGGWLTTVTSRVSLNMLRSRATRGESEYDDALADPIVEPAGSVGDPEASAELTDAVETALLLVLNRLSPAERVAFVLHDTFDVPFEQIGELLDRAPEAARQLASRARRRVRAQSGTTDASDSSPEPGRRIVDAFFAAAREGDFDGLVSLLAPDVALRVDGGLSATAIVRGATTVASRALMFSNPGAVLKPVSIDGRPGALVLAGGVPVSLMAFEVEGDVVIGIDAYTGEERLAGIRLPA
ncbi:sigma-70 family RNA polymerase sigma factor [Humibacter ginsenosidimutans]|uniref:Sigma-70 family RNA polymerase sigma factor n=1 Tax=Humibacter ginsenosidimutans TaxID=2599293 RepID=A0A5B8M7Y0_9MICO|nr:sigma-70 family RNA polymerase sigma factor [Humibacter ginsenosidimutans]QDZ16309.1 sigma-70 family RNA polymerase sigma factor [Humibacter ginsenosidimutans]